MNKKDFMKAMDISSLICIVIASLFVLIYNFVGNAMLLKFSMILFATSFLIAIVFYSLKLSEIVKSQKTKEDRIVLKSEKNQKAITITKIVLVSLVFVFTVVVLVLY